MRIPKVIVGALVILAAGAAGCQKLDTPPPQGEPRTVTLPAIPEEMGELVAVTTAPNWPSNAELWFVKPDKTISMVAVDLKTLRLINTTVLIPRR